MAFRRSNLQQPNFGCKNWNSEFRSPSPRISIIIHRLFKRMGQIALAIINVPPRLQLAHNLMACHDEAKAARDGKRSRRYQRRHAARGLACMRSYSLQVQA